MSIDCYDVLEVSRDATAQEIKSSYKRLALKYHPDRNPDDAQAEEKFKILNSAYHVLMDPEKRAQYDLILNYQEFNSSTTYSSGSDFTTSYDTEPTPPPRSGFTTKRSHYGDKAKEEKIARIWVSSFLLFLVVAMVVYGFTDSYLEQKAQNDLYERKMQLLGRAIDHFKQDDYRASLEELDKIIREQPGDSDVRLLQDEVLEKLHSQADLTYSQANYKKSLEYLLILEDYERHSDLKIRYRLALCNRFLGNAQKAVEILEGIAASGDKDDLRSSYELALIYNRDLDQPDKALEVLDKAADIIINVYREKYGGAFAMLVNPATAPPIQFNVFYERGLVRHKLGYYNDAIRDCTWAAFLKEKNPDVYHLLGQSSFSNGEPAEACGYWEKAQQLGSVEAAEMLGKNCR